MKINDTEVLESVIGSIRDEEIRNEKKIHIGRMSIFVFVLVMACIARSVIGATLNMRFLMIAGLSISCIGIGLLFWRNYRKSKYFSATKYFLVTLDIFFIAVLILIVRFTMSRDMYEITTDIPAFLVIFFINTMSGLRFDLKHAIYCAVASVMILVGFTVYDFRIITNPYPSVA
jgi:hypothetical protein